MKSSCQMSTIFSDLQEIISESTTDSPAFRPGSAPCSVLRPGAISIPLATTSSDFPRDEYFALKKVEDTFDFTDPTTIDPKFLAEFEVAFDNFIMHNHPSLIFSNAQSIRSLQAHLLKVSYEKARVGTELRRQLENLLQSKHQNETSLQAEIDRISNLKEQRQRELQEQLDAIQESQQKMEESFQLQKMTMASLKLDDEKQIPSIQKKADLPRATLPKNNNDHNSVPTAIKFPKAHSSVSQNREPAPSAASSNISDQRDVGTSVVEQLEDNLDSSRRENAFLLAEVGHLKSQLQKEHANQGKIAQVADLLTALEDEVVTMMKLKMSKKKKFPALE